MPAFPSRLPSVRALAELPWFELAGPDRIRLADDRVGSIIDMHAHLALAFGPPMKVDLHARTEQTERYLSLDRPLDLEVYLNKNFSDADVEGMKKDLGILCLTGRGKRRTHTIPNLLAEMSDLRISHTVLLPIELPRISRNAETYLEAVAGEPRLISYGSVHPIDKDAASRLEEQKAMGARGVKIHPAVQLITPDHPRAIEVYRICADLDLPVLWHCGPVGIELAISRWCCQLKHYWRAVHECPDTTFILGHSGALQMELALELAQRYPNVVMELSSQSLGNIKRILDEAPPDRIVLGSDWPFYPQVIQLAKVLMATQRKPAVRRRVLFENAARLLKLA